MKKIIVLFGVVIISVATNAQAVTDGLIGYWPFNGNANDESGLANHGAVNGPTLTIDRYGNANSAYHFDGVDDFINIASDSLLYRYNTSFTITAWVRRTVTGTSFTEPILTNRTTNSGSEFGIDGVSNGFPDNLVYAAQSTSTNIYRSDVIVPHNDYHFVVLVFNYQGGNNNTSLMYIDNVLSGSATNLIDIPLSTADTYIGWSPFFSTQPERHFDGDIDDIGIYNRVLTVDEIAMMYYDEGATGTVYFDVNGNCVQDTNETGLANRLGVIQPGNIFVQTNSAGVWHVDSLPAGSYTITIDTTGNWTSCATTQNFTVLNPDTFTFVPKIGLTSTYPCANPNISVNMPFMRRCFSNQKIYVQACNTDLATGALVNSYVELELDSLITPMGSSASDISFVDLGNNLYRFDLGTLNPGECVDFWLNTDVDCAATLNQTLCIDANLYPADSCVFDTVPSSPPGGVSPCTLPWDKSSLSVEGWCQNDSIYFTVTNTGDFGNGDMQCYAPIRIYIDGVYTSLDSIMLVGGQTQTYIFPGDGRTWRLEADQHPLHPGNSHPNATVELCGNMSNWTPNLVNVLPMDDADPVIDIYCGEVTGSYDPNDKTGYPLGVGNDHIIAPNGKLEYVIRFQNTGTDTAFTVVIRDTLDVDLDIYSIQSGASSHNYTFKIYGQRVLEWTFNNIMLPDSTTDESGSHGFVTFSVLQNPNLPDGTEINNSVGIYFDFNDPIITNTTSHIIGRESGFPVSVLTVESVNNEIVIYPNPNAGLFTILTGEKTKSFVEIYDVMGKQIINEVYTSTKININITDQSKGIYVVKITSGDKVTTQKIVYQ